MKSLLICILMSSIMIASFYKPQTPALRRLIKR